MSFTCVIVKFSISEKQFSRYLPNVYLMGLRDIEEATLVPFGSIQYDIGSIYYRLNIEFLVSRFKA